ncbi:uncharacterized protein LOC113360033 [Papaver somniferum]|uniref:uncharacterized protein LOC113360033 n=1 Tax=Papaver somniferum TaxID=3469 RepID=UPI000E7054E1|nr:uncharacterized protein LOC113360033 [Papaver somniferum]
MLVFAWNCWGLGNDPTVQTLKSFLRSSKPDIVFLSETKLSEASPHSILNRFGTNRSQFWQSLSVYSQHVSGPKCFIGDFTALSSVREKFGGDQSLNTTITQFNSFIHENHLLDLGFSGPAYTWCNGRQFQSLIRERLDRVIATPDWYLMFEKSGVLHLPRISSDHSPILLNTCRNIERNPPSYRFKAYWCTHPDFLKVVLESWNINLSADLISKLTSLGKFLKNWSKNKIGCIRNKIRKLKKRLLHLQSLPPNPNVIRQEKATTSQLNDYIIMEATYWEQIMKQDIAEELIIFFETLFQEDINIQPPSHLQVSSYSMGTEENYSLSTIPSGEEIWKIIKNMNSLGSPGPDGFPVLFYRKGWTIVGEDTTQFIQQIFNTGEIQTKILAVRLSPFLSHFISWSRNAFVKYRQIIDNVVIAKELFHSMNKSKSKQGFFALILDMSKAYDRVSWSFLSFMLHQMGIHAHSHNLITSCFTSPTFSILLNGAPINVHAPTISHLMFVDDLFFFGNNSESNVDHLKHILDTYSSFSGQIINYTKSSIHFSKGTSTSNRWISIQKLGVREMEKDEKYLGTYPLKSDCSIETFEPLNSKFDSKLAGWRNFFVILAGRIVLSKSVLSTVPNYTMGTCILPKGITKELSRTQRAFWWGHDINTRKAHFIKWDKVERPKQDGGLGI